MRRPGSPIGFCPEKSIAAGYAYVYDISKARRELGYEVRYPFMEMLRDFSPEKVSDVLNDESNRQFVLYKQIKNYHKFKVKNSVLL